MADADELLCGNVMRSWRRAVHLAKFKRQWRTMTALCLRLTARPTAYDRQICGRFNAGNWPASLRTRMSIESRLEWIRGNRSPCTPHARARATTRCGGPGPRAGGQPRSSWPRWRPWLRRPVGQVVNWGYSEPLVADRAPRQGAGSRFLRGSTRRARPHSPRHAQHGRHHRPRRPGRVPAAAAGPVRDDRPAQPRLARGQPAGAVSGPHLPAAGPAGRPRRSFVCSLPPPQVPELGIIAAAHRFSGPRAEHASGLRTRPHRAARPALVAALAARDGRAGAAFSGARAVSPRARPPRDAGTHSGHSLPLPL